MLNAVVALDETVPLDEIDLFDPDRFRTGSQHAAWQTLRRGVPVWQQRGPGGIRFWSVTRYADVARVVKDHKSFSSEYGTILAVLGGDLAGGKTINLMDPPSHAGIRVPTMRLLSTCPMNNLEDVIRQRVRDIVAPLAGGGVHDLTQSTLRLALAAVGDVIGIPPDLWSDIPRWTMAGVAPEDPAFACGTVEETLQAAHYELFALFQDLIRQRRRAPRRDIISVLLSLEMNGRRLTPDEVVLNCYSFAMGANTTTPHVANHLLLALAERPHVWAELRRDRSLVHGLVEEALRWTTPTNHLVRRTNVPVHIAGTEIAAGELVCAWTASANRDDTVFDRPFDFDPRRSPNQHLAFGSGVHFCNGAPAARLVLRLFVEELLDVVESVELAGLPTHLYSNFINGMTYLPLSVEPVPLTARRELTVAAVS